MPKVDEMYERRAELPQPLQDLLGYYMGKMVGGNAPVRGSDFSPTALRPWLGSLALIECDGDDYRFRLMGTKLLTRFGLELTGKRLSDLSAEILGDLLDRVRRCDALGSAVSGRAKSSDGRTAFVELLLPLADADGRVSMILLAAYPEEQAPERG